MPPTTGPRHVVLIGAMGTGKSTIGRPLAAHLGWAFVDNDDALEQRAGVTAAMLAQRDGIDALHELEATVLLEAIAAHDATVIDAAASTIERPGVRDALARGVFVVWLHARPDVLARRLPSATRPFGDRDPATLVAEQSSRRDALFADAADASVDTGDGTVASSVARVIAAVEAAGITPAGR